MVPYWFIVIECKKIMAWGLKSFSFICPGKYTIVKFQAHKICNSKFYIIFNNNWGHCIGSCILVSTSPIWWVLTQETILFVYNLFSLFYSALILHTGDLLSHTLFPSICLLLLLSTTSVSDFVYKHCLYTLCSFYKILFHNFFRLCHMWRFSYLYSC